MSVQRVMGIETEYGLVAVGIPDANPMVMSGQLVTAYTREGMPGLAHARWDYQDEDPLADARGFRLTRAAADPSLLTDDPLNPAPEGDRLVIAMRRRPVVAEQGATVANAVLPNGGRFYVDHAHPEYSGPEVRTPRDAVLWDLAGDAVLRRASRLLAQIPGMPDIALYKNNTDGKGASYGMHENYLVDRALPFEDIIAGLTPFLVTRPVFCGAGRVGLGQRGEEAGFQISQRADFIEAEVGLETTLRRPIINTRDEPHARAERYRRLHVIVGDANLVQVSTYLKMGTTALLLWHLEHEGLPMELAALALDNPVQVAQQVSRDLTLTRQFTLRDGREMTALEIQRTYWRVLTEAVQSAPDSANEQTLDVLNRWGSLLDRLSEDPWQCTREIEWLAKLRVLEGMRRRDGIDWHSPRLAALDLQWSELRPERSVYAKLVAAGAVEQLVSDFEVETAVSHPPEDTRAYFRGEVIRRYPSEVAAANWDAVTFDIASAPALQRVPMSDPWRGTRAQVGDLLDASPNAESLLRGLTTPSGDSGT